MVFCREESYTGLVMANPWFRFYAEFLHDPKVRVMSEIDQLRLVLLFCLRCNGSVTLQDKHVTFSLRISDQEWQQTKAVFIESGFIDSANNVLNWDKRQYASDSSVDRVRKHRALHKPVTVTPCNVTVTPPEQNRTEQNRTEQKQKNIRAKRADIFPEIKNRKLVEDWLAIRKLKKLAVTETAISGFTGEVNKAGVTLEEALIKCCYEGWGGFKASWLAKQQAEQPKKAWE